MGRRKDRAEWTREQDAYIREAFGKGLPARVVHAQWPKGFPYRTATAITLRKQKLGVKTTPRPDQMQNGIQQPAPPQEVGSWQVQDDGDEIVVRSFGTEVRTLEELIARAKIDTTKYEVDRPETSMHETTVRDAEGKIRKVQNFRLVARFRLKAGPSTIELVQALIDGAFSIRKSIFGTKPKLTGLDADVLQDLLIPDPHIGKLAQKKQTGLANYDTQIAVKILRQGCAHLIEAGNERRVGQRDICLLGDYFQHDGQGHTTKGTAIDYDSRVQKMLQEGSEVLFDIIEQSAATVPTRVLLVPGNHDRTLTWALQRILLAYFRNHKGVTVEDTFTSTKYVRWGKCLIGYDHGDKGKKRLAEVMAAHCAVEWGQTIYREIHTGHLHGKAAIETHGGVTVRTHAALCPPDQYHAEEKFSVSPRLIEAFYYHKGGAPVGSDVWSPDIHSAPRRGTI